MIFFLPPVPLNKAVRVVDVRLLISVDVDLHQHITRMESPLTTLITDSNRYLKCYHHYLKHCTDQQTMEEFINNRFLDIMTKTVNGKSDLNVIGVGSGSDLVSQTPGLDYIRFNWNQITADEFEEQWKEKKRTEKADLIHMFQVLYYVKDLGATISFYQSLLNKNGQLLMTLHSGNSIVVKLRNTYSNQLGTTEVARSTGDIKRFLDSKGLSYRSYELPNEVDITKCFIEGDEEGEMMIDFLIQVLDFSKTASPELKAGVKEFLCCPEFSVESNGKVLMNAQYELIVLEQLT
ncbi:histamine N-methyltransferase-like isoform X4 [Antennarius striatus]|uniref:histamine N-methyltransferase-like isoform X4 n=1 Tax=Antennarius striatus TaxID=241820 RepID=UPI0035AEA9E4